MDMWTESRLGIAGEGEGWQAGRQAGKGKGVKRDSHRQVKIRLRPLGMGEISLSGEGPGSAGPLYYSDMSPRKAVKLITRGELRDVTRQDLDGGRGGRGEQPEIVVVAGGAWSVRRQGINILCWTVVFDDCSFWPPAPD